MPKMKTRKSMAKRFKKTGSGKLRRFAPGHRHLMTCKSRKRKRKLGSATLVSKGEARNIVDHI